LVLWKSLFDGLFFFNQLSVTIFCRINSNFNGSVFFCVYPLVFRLFERGELDEKKEMEKKKNVSNKAFLKKLTEEKNSSY